MLQNKSLSIFICFCLILISVLSHFRNGLNLRVEWVPGRHCRMSSNPEWITVTPTSFVEIKRCSHITSKHNLLQCYIVISHFSWMRFGFWASLITKTYQLLMARWPIWQNLSQLKITTLLVACDNGLFPFKCHIRKYIHRKWLKAPRHQSCSMISASSGWSITLSFPFPALMQASILFSPGVEKRIYWCFLGLMTFSKRKQSNPILTIVCGALMPRFVSIFATTSVKSYSRFCNQNHFLSAPYPDVGRIWSHSIRNQL